jgi:trk system potassium uptake protein
MNYKIMLRVCSLVLFIEIGCMVPSLLISLYTQDQMALIGFLGAMLIAGALGVVMYGISDHCRMNFYAREGMLVTALVWVLISVIGSIPYYLSGRIPDVVNALFEGISGLTTTGATILEDVESLGKGLLFWRSFSQWIGGMGVLVFFLAIIPSSQKGEGYSLHLLRAELPGPSVNKMVPRMRDTATALYKIYVLMTLVNFILLLLSKMDLFDAACIAFSTAGTGGFSVRNTGLEDYTPMAQWVTTIFMFLFGINFSLYYMAFRKKIKEALRGEELKFYVFMMLGAIVLISANLVRSDGHGTVSKILRDACFQVVSIVTTTGYCSVNYDLWPDFSKAVLLCLMFVGACAGSTGGGIKIARIMILYKAAKRNLHNVFHPEEVRTIKIDDSRVSERTIQQVQGYLSIYVFILIVSFLLVSSDLTSYTITTNFTAVVASLSNIGPGFDTVGPLANFAAYNDVSKLVLCVDMLLGRLEIYPILTMLAYSTYKK